MTSLRVAAVQHDIVWNDRDANFERLAPKVAAAAGAGAGLVLLTETFSTGFGFDQPDFGEAVGGGPSAAFLTEQAREHGVWVGGSCPELLGEPTAMSDERSEDAHRSSPAGPMRGERLDDAHHSSPGPDARPSNVFVLAGPDGTTHRYAKIHPFTHAGEHHHVRAGTELVTVEVAGFRVSMFVCYDLRFADEFWQLALDTDLYLVPANWPEKRRHHWTTLLRARAIENQAYVVGVNRVGEGGGLTYTGDSRIIDPLGEILAGAAGTESILLADLTTEHVASTRDHFRFLPDRR